jgi:alpha-galactosidase
MILPLKFRFDVAMGGRLGLELQPGSLVGDEYDFACRAIAVYKDFVRPLVQLGDLYRLESPYEGTGWSSHMHVEKDKSEAVMFAYCLKYNGRTTLFSTRLKGLIPDAVYKVEEINAGPDPAFPAEGIVCTGDYLMKVGLALMIDKPFSSCILKITLQN